MSYYFLPSFRPPLLAGISNHPYKRLPPILQDRREEKLHQPGQFILVLRVSVIAAAVAAVVSLQTSAGFIYPFNYERPGFLPPPPLNPP